MERKGVEKEVVWRRRGRRGILILILFLFFEFFPDFFSSLKRGRGRGGVVKSERERRMGGRRELFNYSIN